MNNEYLFCEKENHIFLISSGNHEMSFKRYFLRNIIKIPEDKIPPGVYENDEAINSFLREKNYLRHLDTKDIENCKFCPIKIKPHEEIFPKNCEKNSTIPPEKILQPTVNNPMNYDHDFTKEPFLNRHRITMMVHDPLERLIYIYFKYFILPVFKERNYEQNFNIFTSKFLQISKLTLDKFTFSLFLKIIRGDFQYPIFNESAIKNIVCRQTLQNDLFMEKIENLANLLIITTSDIEYLFPGYDEFYKKDDLLANLTTMERLSRIKGVNDLLNMSTPFITRNHIRSGSFETIDRTDLLMFYQNDIDFYKKYKGTFDPFPRQFFITGQVRSGTSYVCKTLSKYIDSPECYLNETGQRAPHLRWKLRGSFFVFKYCEDYMISDILINYFPYSKFYHMIRDIRDQIYTILHPSKNSWPIRDHTDFPVIGALQEKHHCSLFQAICMFLTYKYNDEIEGIINNFINKSYTKIIKYENILIEKGLLDLVKMSYPNRAAMETESSFSSKIKKVNHGSWDKYTDVEKKFIIWNPAISNYLLKHNYITKEELFFKRRNIEKIMSRKPESKNIKLESKHIKK